MNQRAAGRTRRTRQEVTALIQVRGGEDLNSDRRNGREEFGKQQYIISVH